jgi:hypothetical protein
MADLLLQRARDRLEHGIGIKHAGNRRPAHGTAEARPEVFLTRLSGHTQESRIRLPGAAAPRLSSLGQRPSPSTPGSRALSGQRVFGREEMAISALVGRQDIAPPTLQVSQY